MDRANDKKGDASGEAVTGASVTTDTRAAYELVPDSDQEPEEVCRIRIMARVEGDGMFALCQFPGGEEYPLQFFKLLVHTTEVEPGTLEINRSKGCIKSHGRIGLRGEIIKDGDK